ncbi:hypothetical protein, partial [Pontibacter deserti]|uniref:hypothetical protein n=1 Tax=Pontibacter deserti TaxID=1343896 RepID=UPI002027AC1B
MSRLIRPFSLAALFFHVVGFHLMFRHCACLFQVQSLKELFSTTYHTCRAESFVESALLLSRQAILSIT